MSITLLYSSHFSSRSTSRPLFSVFAHILTYCVPFHVLQARRDILERRPHESHREPISCRPCHPRVSCSIPAERVRQKDDRLDTAFLDSKKTISAANKLLKRRPDALIATNQELTSQKSITRTSVGGYTRTSRRGYIGEHRHDYRRGDPRCKRQTAIE